MSVKGVNEHNAFLKVDNSEIGARLKDYLTGNYNMYDSRER